MSHYTTFEERLEIENGLRGGRSFGEIAKGDGISNILWPTAFAPVI